MTYRLIQGDCVEVMKTLPNNSIDIIFTSPPYNCGLPYKSYDDNLSVDEFQKFNQKWMRECSRILAEDSRMYVVCSDKLLFDIVNISKDLEINFVQLLVWCKPNLSGGSGKITGDWNFLTENIPLFRKGKRTAMLNGNTNTHNFFVIPQPQSNFNYDKKVHIAQFSLDLPKRILARTPGQVVLDCFAGSGATGVACVELNRDFIGIEIDPDYIEMAEKRISRAAQQMALL